MSQQDPKSTQKSSHTADDIFPLLSLSETRAASEYDAEATAYPEDRNINLSSPGLSRSFLRSGDRSRSESVDAAVVQIAKRSKTRARVIYTRAYPRRAKFPSRLFRYGYRAWILGSTKYTTRKGTIYNNLILCVFSEEVLNVGESSSAASGNCSSRPLCVLACSDCTFITHAGMMSPVTRS